MSSSPNEINNCTVSNNSDDGIYCINSLPVITGCTVSGNGENGVYCSSSSPSLRSGFIQDNGNYAMYLNGNSFPNLSGNTFSGNVIEGIAIAGGSLTTSGTWHFDADEPYMILGDVVVYNSATLTVDPGTTIKFNSDAGLRIGMSNYSKGEIYAVGKSDSLITFTSLGDTINGWDGIYFSDESDYAGATSMMSYCVVEKAGQNGWWSSGVAANIFCYSTIQPTLSYCTIRESGGQGIYLSSSPNEINNCTVSNNSDDGIYCINSSPTITFCTISNNQTQGIYCNNSDPLINYCNIINNTTLGVLNNTSSINLSVENNWWCDPTGPLDESNDRSSGGLYNPNGKGDGVSDYVNYEPWLTEPYVQPVDTTQTIPPGDPDPIVSPQIQLSLDFQSGPGGNVTIEESSTYPPLSTKQDADIRLEKAAATFISGSVRDSLRFVRKYWKLSSQDIEAGTFTANLGIKYNISDFTDGLAETDISILYLQPDSSRYEIIPTTTNTLLDSTYTKSTIDHLGTFALGDFYVSTNTYSFYSQGWHMVSLPISPQNGSINEIFPTALGGFVYSYDGAEYQPVDSMEVGKGYWLALPEAWEGNYMGESEYEFTLHFDQPGWYIIGGTRDIIDFTNPNDDPDGSVLTPAFTYNVQTHEYEESGSLHTRTGYWIAVLNECDLTIGSNPSGMQKPKEISLAILNKFYDKFGSSPPELPLINWETGELIKIPKSFALRQNYPNPFNPTTTIEFDLPEARHVKIVIYNMMGQKVFTLIDREMPTGTHQVIWKGKNKANLPVSSGIYLFNIKADDFTAVKKMMLIR